MKWEYTAFTAQPPLLPSVHLDPLGEKGWELVAMQTLRSSHGGIEYQFVFKRPIPETIHID